MLELKRKPFESEEKYIWRLGQAYDAGQFKGTWDDIGRLVNSQFRQDVDHYMDSSRYRKMYQSAKRMLDAGVFAGFDADSYIASVEESKRALLKERAKLRTEKMEYDRWLRENARDELITEKIVCAIKDAPPVCFPARIAKRPEAEEDRSGVLIFGDCHYGAEFEIRGLHGEVINAYSPEVFERRMEKLLAETVSLAEKEGLTEIRVFEIGDSADGVLRVGQLMKLRYGVVEQSVRYANYLACWLNELSRHVRVRFQMVYGNHTELRFFNQKKGAFADENVGMYIREIVKARLSGNENIIIETNPSGLIHDVIQGYSVLGIHGEVKDMASALKDFSLTYGEPINILIGGHTHHLLDETVGVDKEVVTAPSVIGIDDFAMSLNKTSRPGATFIIIENGNGIVTEHRIKL